MRRTAPPHWTNEEIETLTRMYHAKATDEEIADAVGRSAKAVAHKLRDVRRSSPRPIRAESGQNPAATGQPATLPINEFRTSAEQTRIKQLEAELARVKSGGNRVPVTGGWQAPDPADLWRLAEEDSDQRIEKAKASGKFKTTFDDGPICIAAISDQHIAPGTPVAFRRMREDAEFIRDTPDVYAVLAGDAVDNHIKHRSAVLAARSQPHDQWVLFEHYLQILADKLLVMCSGNHDAWTDQIAGVDMVGQIASRQRLCYCPFEARIDVEVGKHNYRLAVRHQYRFNSSLNQTHTIKRWYDMGDETFDIGIIGHHHEPAVESFVRHGELCWAARPGSYQITSSYSRQYGFNRTFPTCPSFVLFPGERRIVGFQSVYDAADAMHGFRRT